MDIIYTFYTVSEALKFEKALKDNNIKVELMPVPRSLSSSCGTCAKINTLDLEKVNKIIEDKLLEFDDSYNL